jgi:hyperosmotically inducible periplasmic protein
MPNSFLRIAALLCVLGGLADSAMAGADVSVNTDAGVVTLTGTVKSQEQAAIASAHAQHYDGVMRVDNHLSNLPQ